MWMEVKAVFTVIAIVFLAIVISQILFFSPILAFLLIGSIFLLVMGDLLIGIKTNDYKALYDPTPKGFEPMELQLLDGNVHFINTRKGHTANAALESITRMQAL